jgi:hypothetical protein
VDAERGGDAAPSERGQDPDGGDLADRGPVAGDVDQPGASHRAGGFVDGDGDEAAAPGQAGEPGDVVRAGRLGRLVGVVLDRGGGCQFGLVGGRADGRSRPESAVSAWWRGWRS